MQITSSFTVRFRRDGRRHNVGRWNNAKNADNAAPPAERDSRLSLPMATLAPVFIELRKIMAPYGPELEIKRDAPGDFYVETRHLGANKKAIFFGAVQEKAKFVSYHLMPVYSHPELLEGISPELRARMQGKSCFNFNQVDAALMKQLAALTKRSFEEYKKVGYV